MYRVKVISNDSIMRLLTNVSQMSMPVWTLNDSQTMHEIKITQTKELEKYLKEVQRTHRHKYHSPSPTISKHEIVDELEP